jgi:hypothetical protein
MISLQEKKGFLDKGRELLTHADWEKQKGEPKTPLRRISRLMAADDKKAGRFLLSASRSEDEAILQKACQVFSDGILALRPSCVGQYNSPVPII